MLKRVGSPMARNTAAHSPELRTVLETGFILNNSLLSHHMEIYAYIKWGELQSNNRVASEVCQHYVALSDLMSSLVPPVAFASVTLCNLKTRNVMTCKAFPTKLLILIIFGLS